MNVYVHLKVANKMTKEFIKKYPEFKEDFEEILDKHYVKKELLFKIINILMNKAGKDKLIEKQKVKDTIIYAMKESGGEYADIESTEPSECMAGILLEKLSLE